MLCGAVFFELIHILLSELIPTFEPFQNRSLALVDVLDRCYNDSVPEWLHNESYVEPDEYPRNVAWVSGCPVAY